MKTLVIAAHPALHHSRVHRRWLEEARRYPDDITLSSLYEKYPDSRINVAEEQALIEAHDRIILQFPFYWLSSPPLLKQWMDEVLLEGWAYGKDVELFKGKTIGIATSAGVTEEEYGPEGHYPYDVKTLLSPFETTAYYIQAAYETPFVIYGVTPGTSDEEIERSVASYMQYVLQTDKAAVPQEQPVIG